MVPYKSLMHHDSQKRKKNIISFIYCFQYITRRILKNFKIISELENIKQDDLKDEAKEKHLEEVPEATLQIFPP